MIGDSLSNFISRPPHSFEPTAARIADSSSRNAVSFSSAYITKRFRLRDSRQQSRLSAPHDRWLTHSPNSIRLC